MVPWVSVRSHTLAARRVRASRAKVIDSIGQRASCPWPDGRGKPTGMAVVCSRTTMAPHDVVTDAPVPNGRNADRDLLRHDGSFHPNRFDRRSRSPQRSPETETRRKRRGKVPAYAIDAILPAVFEVVTVAFAYPGHSYF
ncbi:hypothetical protein RC1_3914 [Rhodospirillum centenum SW]|uniref:Uncharacterized protein n=1 Tax=Rhodospirillum centenum (strain ATCC 51521 / SW) TaxID=414684 RepID=B6IY82_RHOCS|nr:hypothetical protein RC1_3914 [Rhodospirillum centenum SW]